MRTVVTGGAGFIGSHLVDALVERGDDVTVLDDVSTGLRANIAPDARLIVASVTDPDAVADAVAGAEVVFHLAALGAVARSVADPIATNRANAEGTLNVLLQARDVGARRLVFASSSSVYGGAQELPTSESAPTRPRSPYAVSKLAAEWHCRVFSELFELETVILRYFNVFGPRQRHDAAYAAVMPRFASALLDGKRPIVYGDGLQSRDFTYVSDVVTAITRAKQAAGEKNVLVHGAAVTQLALSAGVLDELELHVIPVLLGHGRRLFDNLSPEHIELERTRILVGDDGVTHMHCRVKRQ